MRVWTQFVACLALTLSAVPSGRATTLQKLTLDDMSRQSTAIVRVRVTGSHSAYRGASIYTYFQLQVLETWKGRALPEVAIPGGVVDGIRENVSGAPELRSGQEYVLFLWTSRSGLTQLIGLSQGLFQVSKVSEEGSGSGVAVVQRLAASELMIDRSGLRVEDHAASMQLPDLHARVLQALEATRK